jgi:hypothetical protein
MRTASPWARLLCAALVSPAAIAGTFDVGSPPIDRIQDDSASGVIYLYLGGTQPLAGPGAIQQWSFFDDGSASPNANVTPLLYEVTGPGQWTVVAMGTTRTSDASGVQTHPFAAITGNAALQPGKAYTIGFTHRGYTGTGMNVVADGGNTGVVDFTGYGNYSDRWAYAFGTAALGTVLGTGGLSLDGFGLGGRIYSASFSIDADPSIPVAYCTSGTSSSGCEPVISSAGTASVSASSGFTLQVANVEGAKLGLVFYGVGGRVITPWGQGASFLCVKAPTQRMGVANSGGTPGQCNGAFATDWLAFVAANPGALGAPFAAGELVNAQAWYRDPPSPKTTNLSNALEFPTVP